MMWNCYKNVILSPPKRAKNLSLREYDNLSPKIVFSTPLAPQSCGEY